MPHTGEFEGKDLEEVLKKAAGELGIPEPELHYEIVEQGRRGVLGLGVKNVRIRVLEPIDPASGVADDESAAAEGDRGRPKGLERIRSTAQRMLDLMGVEIEVRVSANSGVVQVDLTGPDQRMVLERDGELLSALQFLLNRMGRRLWSDAGRIQLRCDGRDGRDAVSHRDSEIVELAREVAQQVARTGRTKKLPQLNSYERRLVHLTVREFAGLTSSSDGAGSLKSVRISKVRNTVT